MSEEEEEEEEEGGGELRSTSVEIVEMRRRDSFRDRVAFSLSFFWYVEQVAYALVEERTRKRVLKCIRVTNFSLVFFGLRSRSPAHCRGAHGQARAQVYRLGCTPKEH